MKSETSEEEESNADFEPDENFDPFKVAAQGVEEEWQKQTPPEENE